MQNYKVKSKLGKEHITNHILVSYMILNYDNS